MVCTKDGCERPRRALGMCDSCYRRERYRNDPLVRERHKAVVYRNRTSAPAVRSLPCSIPGCPGRCVASDLCGKHQQMAHKIRLSPLLTDGPEPRVSSEPLVPNLRKIAAHGASVWFGSAQHGGTDTIQTLARRCAEIDGLSAVAWERRLHRILAAWTADGVARSNHQRTMKAGDADVLCYALGTHPIFFWPELWVPAQQGLDAA